MKSQYLILSSLLLLVVSFWNRNELPIHSEIHPDLASKPIQMPVQRSEFPVNVDGNDYFIQPLYDYEIYGMVVSYRLHNGDTGAHLRWGDYLNVADYCVVWSESAFEKNLSELEFWNQEWTCYWQTSNLKHERIDYFRPR